MMDTFFETLTGWLDGCPEYALRVLSVISEHWPAINFETRYQPMTDLSPPMERLALMLYGDADVHILGFRYHKQGKVQTIEYAYLGQRRVDLIKWNKRQEELRSEQKKTRQAQSKPSGTSWNGRTGTRQPHPRSAPNSTARK